ncbi:MAG: tetratricopeptide repeat protein [Candidatus Omnitrophica bacterium]|nr:tetratricopeptide repeat protein [Candidatus Omnitrophota bacterium]
MRKAALFLILIILVIYANSFRNEFVWDDNFLILKNPSITAWNYAWIHFAIDLYHSYSNYYRPIQMISYMFDYSLWRFNVFGYHLTNVILHILVCISALYLFQVISKDTRVAFLGAVLYAVHPVHTGSVTYIAGRADSLTTLFMLLSVILFHKHFKTKSASASIIMYIGSLISYLLALMSKEIALMLPIIVLTCRLCFVDDKEVTEKRQILKFHYISPYIVICAVYAILRLYALNFQDYLIPPSRYSIYSRLLTSIKAVGIYMGVATFPLELRMERSIAYVHSLFDKEVIITLAIAVLASVLIYRQRKILSRPAIFGIIFFCVAILPLLNIYPLQDNMAEHWLYTPLVGACLFISSISLSIWDSRENLRIPIVVLIACYAALLSFRTVARNNDWRNEDTIYHNTYYYNPASIKILNNLGNMYHARGDFNNAVFFHKEALKINPREHKTLYNLGRDYEEMGLIDNALEQYKKSVSEKRDYAKAYLKIGDIYYGKLGLGEAILFYKKAIQYDRLLTQAHIGLGDIYYDMGQYDEAKVNYDDAVRIEPHLPQAYNNLGNALFRMGLHEEAIINYKKAIDLAPAKLECLLNLGVTYGILGRYNEALDVFEQARVLKPDNVEVIINIGVAYYHTGRREEAKRQWRRALAIQPQNKVALLYLDKFE